MKIKILLIILLSVFTQLSFGEIKKADYLQGQHAEVVQWQVLDLTFDTEIPVDKPFSIEFGARFSGPSHKIVKVPGFYNGKNQWVLRFSNAIEGQWEYTTHSSLKDLNGLSGKVTVTPNQDPDQHGAIVVDETNPQHVYYEDGKPYMMLAFECDWLFALDYGNTKSAPKTEHLLKLLNKNGINQIVTTVYSYDVGWTKDEKLKQHPEHEYGGKKDIFPFLGTNEAPDYSALNIKFFQHFDRMMSLMQDNKIMAHLMIYVWNKKVNWPDTGSEADNMYFNYIIKRYQAFPNIIWDISKEALNNPRCTEAYGLERIKRINILDAFNRLVTVHDFGFCSRNPEQVDIISWQNWNSTLYNDMLQIRNKYTSHPVFNIEHGGYEKSPYDVFSGDYIDPQICLRRNYLCHFAGGYSTYYWQGAAWNVIIHNPFEQPDEFIKPKFEYYRHLVSFFQKYSFSEFKPDPGTNNSGYCLKNDTGCYLYYVPKENHKLSIYWKHPPARKVGTMQWFNTLTGQYSDVQKSTSNQFISPYRGIADAILIRKLK